MQKNDLFLIESDRCGNRLSLNGHDIATFATLDAAEVEAQGLASQNGTRLATLNSSWTLNGRSPGHWRSARPRWSG